MNWQHQLSCMIHSGCSQLKHSIILPVIFSYIDQCYTSRWETIKSHWDIRYVHIERTLTLRPNYQGAGHQTDIEPKDGHSPANTGGWVLAIDIRFPPPVVAMTGEALLIHWGWGHQSGATQWHRASSRNWFQGRQLKKLVFTNAPLLLIIPQCLCMLGPPLVGTCPITAQMDAKSVIIDAVFIW